MRIVAGKRLAEVFGEVAYKIVDFSRLEHQVDPDSLKLVGGCNIRTIFRKLYAFLCLFAQV